MFYLILLLVLVSGLQAFYCLNLNALKVRNTHLFTKQRSQQLKSSQHGLAGVLLGLGLFTGSHTVLADDRITPDWAPGVRYTVLKAGPKRDLKAKVGENVAIRFKGSYKGTVFDDTFRTEQPYFYRAGVGLILKGIDESVTHMAVGDKWKLEFGGEYSFEKGRPSSPGKPRIPAGAEVEYEVELVEIPGTLEDFIADYDGSE
jgi:hypothetical protein